MRKAVGTFALIFFAFSAVAHGGGHGGLPEPGKTPGDLLYSLDRASESVSLALTFNEEKKVRKKVKFAQERLSESVAMTQENKSGKSTKALQAYSRMMSEANRSASKSDNEELKQFVREQRKSSVGVLESLKSKLPGEAMKGINTALENTNRTRDNRSSQQENRPESSGNSSSRGTENEQNSDQRSETGFIATGRVVE